MSCVLKLFSLRFLSNSLGLRSAEVELILHSILPEGRSASLD